MIFPALGAIVICCITDRYQCIVDALYCVVSEIMGNWYFQAHLDQWVQDAC